MLFQRIGRVFTGKSRNGPRPGCHAAIEKRMTCRINTVTASQKMSSVVVVVWSRSTVAACAASNRQKMSVRNFVLISGRFKLLWVVMLSEAGIGGDYDQRLVGHLRVDRVGPLMRHERCWRQRLVQKFALLLLQHLLLLLLLQKLLLLIAENEWSLSFGWVRNWVLRLFLFLLENADDDDEEEDEDGDCQTDDQDQDRKRLLARVRATRCRNNCIGNDDRFWK